MADSNFCAGCQRGNEDVQAISWCSDCTELVCKACARVHEKMSPPHKVVPMKEIQQLSSSLLNLSKNCENHPDQKIVLFCCQHDKVICDSCVPVSHQNCKSIISIEKAARSVNDGTAISDLERRMDDLRQVTENILSQTEATLGDLSKSRNNIKKRVSEIKQKIVAHLDKLEAEIHKDINSQYKYCTEMVARTKDSARSSTDSLSTWKSDLKSLKQHASEIHLFQVVKFLDAKTHGKELEIREIQTATVPILAYHPSESEFNIKKLFPDLGTITVDNVQVPTPVLNIDQQCQFLVRDNKKLSLTHSFQTTKLPDGVRIFRGCLIPGDKLLLVQCMNDKLYVSKLDGSKPKVINLDYSPQCITLYDNNHALVSLGDKGIQIIDLTTLKPGRKIKVGGYCKGITSVKDKIWVQNQENTLTIVDINGKVLNTIHTTFDPWDICANTYGDVYCTAVFSDKVYVVTSDGKERKIYSSRDLKDAGDVTVDDRGDVYVAGKESNNIHRISNDGQKHGIVLTADDGIKQPTGLSYNCEKNELLVINDDGKTINIYKTQ
ncbi:uncharacterized protein LOC127727860 [Mytilus californianus]|uniref:uncharacterized protein LOC127727860 n=1 Tax=Mytilus californianus TaxID=6549 RepID=UPI0022462AE6|nr:uncharacterized protein LOC127727860 [Mytilus californianus]